MLIQQLKRRIISLPISFILMSLVAMAMPIMSHTATLTETESGVTFTGGVSSVTLNGTSQTLTYTLPIVLTDNRGSGAGWKVTLASTDLTDGASHTLASAITADTAVCHTGTTCSDATLTATSSGNVNAAAGTIVLVDAAINTGLGQYDVTPTITISVPSLARAGTYTSTLTVSDAAAP